jgi:hypothetical protein
VARLEHVFAAGIRFDTEIQYLTQATKHLRYHKLPVLKSESVQVCVLTSVMQCVLIVGRMQRGQLTPEHKLMAQRALGRAAHPGCFSVLRCVRVLENLTGANPQKSAITHNPVEMGETALEVLRSGGLCLLQFESATARRWATVIGVEIEVQHDKAFAKALLLLDSHAGEPWACAHNVRIELKRSDARSQSAAIAFPLICRHLTGEASKVQLLNLITLKPAATKPQKRTGEQI